MSIMHHLKKYNKGKIRYTPKNAEKYVGKNIPVCRSGWEVKFCQWLDRNSKVQKWASEEVAVTYFDHVTKKKRQYFPDFVAVMDTNNGIKTFMIEIKPTKDTKPSRISKKKSPNSIITEQRKYINNISKFNAAKSYCSRRGWEFVVLTEKELFGFKGL